MVVRLLRLRRLAPLDIPLARTLHGLRALFSHYNIPSEFVAERLHSVTHSFGWYQDAQLNYGEICFGVTETVVSHVLLQYAGFTRYAKVSRLSMTRVVSLSYGIHVVPV